jgi:hypothetical protein
VTVLAEAFHDRVALDVARLVNDAPAAAPPLGASV